MLINIETKTDWLNQKDKGNLFLFKFSLFLPPGPLNKVEVKIEHIEKLWKTCQRFSDLVLISK